MEQLTFFNVRPPYRYIFDTSAILSQKDNEPYRRKVYGQLWENVERLMRNRIIVTCSEVKEEIKDENILKWLMDNGCIILNVDDEVQNKVIKVVTTNPHLIDFKQIKSSGDAFLIATAMKYSLIVVTEENKDSYKKIPKVCKYLDVLCVSMLELCERENWAF